MARRPDNYDLLMDMREDIIQCYREIAPDCLWQQSAWRRIAKHPAKRFYVTPKQAYQKINYWLNGRPEEIDGMKRKLQRQMYYDLIKVALEVAQEPQNVGLSLKKIVSIAVKRPAPRFYLSETYIKDIFRKMTKGEYTEEGHDLFNTLRNRAHYQKRKKKN